MLHCVALCCSVFERGAVWCSELQLPVSLIGADRAARTVAGAVAVCCTILHCVLMCCVVVCCTVLQFVAATLLQRLALRILADGAARSEAGIVALIAIFHIYGSLL